MDKEQEELRRTNRVAMEVSAQAIGRPIGDLQKRRSARNGLIMVPQLFDGRSIRQRYAYHVGGLAELQYNIGFEHRADVEVFRHGLALSLQPTRTHSDIRALIPRIERFNEFMRTHPDQYPDLEMWHFLNRVRSENYAPGVIPERLVRPHVFIFLGALQPPDSIDIDWILDDFDRLVPLYDYVEGSESFPRLAPLRKGFHWAPGNNARAAGTTFKRTAIGVDVSLRHNVLQNALYNHLEKLYGRENTSGEQDCGNGTPVDIAVRNRDRYTYYELKTGLSAQSCIRQAMGQLMEYSFWPGAKEAEKLVIVGEPPLDSGAKKYLRRLRKSFALPLYYQQFNIKESRLIG